MINNWWIIITYNLCPFQPIVEKIRQTLIRALRALGPRQVPRNPFGGDNGQGNGFPGFPPKPNQGGFPGFQNQNGGFQGFQQQNGGGFPGSQNQNGGFPGFQQPNGGGFPGSQQQNGGFPGFQQQNQGSQQQQNGGGFPSSPLQNGGFKQPNGANVDFYRPQGDFGRNF